MKTKLLFFFLPILLMGACRGKGLLQKEPQSLDDLSREYVRLALQIGQHDKVFVDAYYGPDSLKPAESEEIFLKDSVLNEIYFLIAKVKDAEKVAENDTLRNRAGWIIDQLLAFAKRVKIFTRDYDSFDNESKDLYGVAAPTYDEQHYKDLIGELDSILPGEGDVPARFQSLAYRFIIPKDKLDAVFKAAIDEARKRTIQYIPLPEEESFTLEYVTDKSWSGYNWYKGGYKSIIQLNTDIPIFIERAIDVGSHESYPGHHVYNMLLEKNLYHDRGYVEMSMYPLFSPQSLIAEGTANYGIEMAFPGQDKVNFCKDVLLPLAGLDTTGITTYFKALEIKGKLNYARNEAARGIINNSMKEEQAMYWLENYALYSKEAAAKSIDFIVENRSYVINYNYGMDLVSAYIEEAVKDDPTHENRWKVFSDLMSRQVRIQDLVKGGKKADPK